MYKYIHKNAYVIYSSRYSRPAYTQIFQGMNLCPTVGDQIR